MYFGGAASFDYGAVRVRVPRARACTASGRRLFRACVHGRLRGGDADCDAFIAESLVAAVARPYGEPDEARVKRTGAFHAICRCIGGQRLAVLGSEARLVGKEGVSTCRARWSRGR